MPALHVTVTRPSDQMATSLGIPVTPTSGLLIHWNIHRTEENTSLTFTFVIKGITQEQPNALGEREGKVRQGQAHHLQDTMHSPTGKRPNPIF